MLFTRFFVWMFSVAISVLGAGVACGQNYPNKPIRMVTGEAGGGADFAARIVAQGISASLGQQVVVENRGGSSIIPAQLVALAPPDGYTLLTHSSSIWIVPLIQKAPYDALKDFAPITLAARAPNVVVVHPAVPANSINELIALAKAKPGALNYGSGASGSSNHLSVELFKAMAGVNIVHVPYKGAGSLVTGLISGEVQLMIGSAGSIAPHIQSGGLRALAVTSARPSALFPRLPTVSATGLPGYEAGTPYVLVAPAGTPRSVITRLNEEIVRVLSRTDVKERFLNAGVEPVGNSPEEVAAWIRSDITKWEKVIRDADIRAR